MSYPVYKVIHLTGVFFILLSFGGIYLKASEGTKVKWLMGVNGLGLFLSLLGGFGLIARLGLGSSWPVWIFLKLGIWVLFAILPSIAMRTKADPKAMTFLSLAIGSLAVYIINFKPFM